VCSGKHSSPPAGKNSVAEDGAVLLRLRGAAEVSVIALAAHNNTAHRITINLIECYYFKLFREWLPAG
jgi:stage V sporulation protein SpoVS